MKSIGIRELVLAIMAIFLLKISIADDLVHRARSGEGLKQSSLNR